MSTRDPNTDFDPGVDGSDEEGIDIEALKEKLGFVLRAGRRRPKLTAFVFLVVAGLGITVAVTMPRWYRVEVKLAAQQDAVTQELSNPQPGVGQNHSDNPSRDVANVILRRDNLIALVRQADLVDRWYAGRSPALRLKDRILAIGSDPPTRKDQETMLAETLEKRLNVWADESSVTIDVEWNDPQLTYELATLVQKNFVDARYDTDMAMIEDAISLLEEHAKSEAQQVDQALAAYQALEASTQAATASAPATAPSPSPPPVYVRRAPAAAAPATAPSAAPAPDPDVVAALEEKRHAIRQMEDERQRELDGLKQQLTQAQLTLTPLHPTVIALKQKIDAMSTPPPELVQLKAEERALMAQIAPASSPATPAATTPAATNRIVLRSAPAAPLAASRTALPPREDPALAPARSKLEAAIHAYQEVMGRLDSARLELDITKTAFRHRYGVITPAEVPRRPKKPIAQLVAIGSVLGAALLALLFAAFADWRAGRVLETWQVRRRLKIDVLGELEGPP